MISPKNDISFRRLGARISVARRARGWTRGTLESKANLCRGTIRHYESGNWIPRIDTLARISLALDVPINWMVFGNHPPKADRELMQKLVKFEMRFEQEQNNEDHISSPE